MEYSVALWSREWCITVGIIVMGLGAMRDSSNETNAKAPRLVAGVLWCQSELEKSSVYNCRLAMC